MRKWFSMKKYLFIIYTYLKKRAAYKFDVVIGFLLSFIIAYTYKCFWQNMYASGKIPQGELSDYISYSAFTAVIGIIFGGEIIGSFSEKIRDGSVISDLQKPVSFQLYTMAGNLGCLLGNILFDIIPKFLVINFLIGIYIPTKPLSIVLFGVSFLLGCMIMAAIDYIFSIFAICFVEVISLIILKNIVIGLFAGLLIPFWIFPEKLLYIINLLPFRLICFLPISIYLEKINDIDIINSLVMQVFWLIVLCGIGKFMSHILLKRITVGGG